MNRKNAFLDNCLALKRRSNTSLGALCSIANLPRSFISNVGKGHQAQRFHDLLWQLYYKAGVSPSDLVIPRFRRAEDGEYPHCAPINPYYGRPTIAEAKERLAGSRFICTEDPILEHSIVFERPDRGAKVIRTAIVGRRCLIAIEAGLTTPKSIDFMVNTSPSESFQSMSKMLSLMEDGELLESSRKQVLYVPPHYIVTCLVESVFAVMEFEGREVVVSYSEQVGRVQKKDPGHRLSGGALPILMDSSDFEAL